jgi:hypothetical protein
MTKFSVYLIGYMIFVAGVAFALDTAGLSGRWTFISVLILLGIGIAMGATRTKRDDPPAV